MRQMGLNLSAEDIYSLNQACLKDAVITLNGGSCTAELISSRDSCSPTTTVPTVQSRASARWRTTSTNGFWAMSLEKKPIPGFGVTFLQRIEDVTERVLADVTADMDEGTASRAIQAAIGQIREVESARLPSAGQVLLPRQRVLPLRVPRLPDIRLVGNPPEASANSVATPATGCGPATRRLLPPSHLRRRRRQPGRLADQRPYQPGALKVSLDSVQNGDHDDHGLPGQHRPLPEQPGHPAGPRPLQPQRGGRPRPEAQDHEDAHGRRSGRPHPVRRQVCPDRQLLEVLHRPVQRFEALDVYGKEALEDEFTAWMSGNADREALYKDLSILDEYYANTDATVKEQVYSLEAGLIGCDLMLFAFRVGMGAQGLFSEDADRAAAAASLQVGLAASKLTVHRPRPLHPAHDQVPGRRQRTSSRPSSRPYGTSTRATSLGTPTRCTPSFLTDPVRTRSSSRTRPENARQGPRRGRSHELIDTYGYFASPGEQFDQGYRLLTAGLREMQPEKMSCRTPLHHVPQLRPSRRLRSRRRRPRLCHHRQRHPPEEGQQQPGGRRGPDPRDRIRNEDYGRYADENGDLVLCFISGNDITGGNSGPVLNGDGDLIGLAFDGNWRP